MFAFFNRSRATKLVVVAGLGVVEDVAQLLQVRRPQVVGDVAHRGLRQERQRLGRDLQERAGSGVDRRHAVGRQQPVFGRVGPEREQLGVGELWHALRLRPHADESMRP